MTSDKNSLIGVISCILTWDIICFFTLALNLSVSAVFQYYQLEESLSDMDFQLLLDLYFTDGDYT